VASPKALPGSAVRTKADPVSLKRIIIGSRGARINLEVLPDDRSEGVPIEMKLESVFYPEKKIKP